jgi:hypothetical protein
MYLIQILLPLQDNHGRPIAPRHFERFAGELSERFGGLTAYVQAPAEGLWKKKRGAKTSHDQIVIYEVVAKRLDRRWWKQRRPALEKTFRQQQIMIRASAISRL